jgi:hypothetical protein
LDVTLFNDRRNDDNDDNNNNNNNNNNKENISSEIDATFTRKSWGSNRKMSVIYTILLMAQHIVLKLPSVFDNILLLTRISKFPEGGPACLVLK